MELLRRLNDRQTYKALALAQLGLTRFLAAAVEGEATICFLCCTQKRRLSQAGSFYIGDTMVIYKGGMSGE